MEIVELLIKNGTSLDVVSGNHASALYAASSDPDLKTVRFLGADLDIVGGNDGTALQASSRFCFLDIVKFLVEKGADLDIIVGGRYLGTAHQAASSMGNLEMRGFSLRGVQIQTLWACFTGQRFKLNLWRVTLGS